MSSPILVLTGWHLLIALLAIAALFAGVLRWRTLVFRQRLKRMGEELMEQQYSLSHKNVELSHANRAMKKQTQALFREKAASDRAHADLKASIEYAQRIQKRLLDSDHHWEKVGRDYFIFYHPKEAIGGDFYWSYADKSVACWAVGDCTGHGVPGALMSMLGVSFLNEIVADGGERDPAFVLELLRAKIIHILNQAGKVDEYNQDGMDIGLCVLDLRSRALSFAGAHHTLYVVRDAEREEPEGASSSLTQGNLSLYDFKGDRLSVGKHLREYEGFLTQSFPVWNGDTLYMCSDGLPDQLGGPKGKKFMASRLKSWLLSHQNLPMAQQKAELDKMFASWLAGSPIGQVDDVCLAGVRM